MRRWWLAAGFAVVALGGGLVGCGDDSCEWNGKTYARGMTFAAGDGCNTCTCGEDGQVACTLIACQTDAGVDASDEDAN